MIKKLSLLTQTHSQLYWQDGMKHAVYGSCFWCYLTVVTKCLSAQWFQFWRPFVQCSPHTPNLTSNIKENFENLSSSIKQTSVKALFWHTSHQGRTVVLFHSSCQAGLGGVILAFVSSCLNYCNPLYSGLRQNSVTRLHLIQNKFTETRQSDLKLSWFEAFIKVVFVVTLKPCMGSSYPHCRFSWLVLIERLAAFVGSDNSNGSHNTLIT